MMDDILDDLQEPELKPDRKKVDRMILIYAAITSVLFLLYDFFTVDDFATYSFDLGNGIRFYPRGLLILGILILICNLLVRKLNEIAPLADKHLFAIWGGSCVFYADLLKRILLIFAKGIIHPMSFWIALKTSMVMSLLAGSICYVVIHRIRNKNVLVPYLIMLGIWIATGLLLKIIL